MNMINAVAAYSTAASNERVSTEAGIRVLKMANDQQAAVAELLLKTLEATATGLGQHIDVKA